MKTNVYAVYDVKSETYSTPFLADNDIHAKRITQLSMEGDSFLGRYPQDYRLEKVAEYEDTFAMFDSPEKKEIVCDLTNLVILPFDGDVTDDGEGKAV